MTSLRSIQTEGYAKLTPPSSFGKPPRLEWIAIRDLIVDPEYQREITGVGRKNIRSIASTFNWSMFSTVIVAAAGSNKFAIVDGQHRVTAAALCGIDRVPCAIIECSIGEQAAAFRAINHNTTRLHTVQLHHAALIAGEPSAKAIAAICAAADVTVPRYKGPRIAARATVAIKTIGRCGIKFGNDVTILALDLIACNSGEDANNALRKVIIHGACEVLADHSEWCADRERLARAFSDLDLVTMQEEAFSIAARMRGTSTLNQFEARLVEALARHFQKARRTKVSA